MKNTLIAIVLLYTSIEGFSQNSLQSLGVGLNYSGTIDVPMDMVNSNFEDNVSIDMYDYANLSRSLTSYEVSLKPIDRKFFFIDVDLLAGAENISSFIYDSYNVSDTSFNREGEIKVNSSLLGVKAVGKVTTPTKNRVFFNAGVGFEALRAYNVYTSASSVTNVSSWRTNYFATIRDNSETRDANAYSSFALLQQFGASVRLGKDETRYPLNQTFVELDVQINNNFTTMNDVLGKYRTYGFTLSLVHELGGEK